MSKKDWPGGQKPFSALFVDFPTASCWSSACDFVCVSWSHGIVLNMLLWILQTQSRLAQHIKLRLSCLCPC